MNKIVNLVVAGLMFVGWIVYLAGVAQSTNLCVKGSKGELSMSDLIKSGPDAPDKNFFPLMDPWGQPKATMGGSSSASSPSSSSSPSSTSTSSTSGLTPAQQAQLQAALSQLGRKLMGSDESLFPTHARSLMGVPENNCGWTYSLAWWTVALQGITTFGIIALAAGFIGQFKPTFAAFLYIVTALLCGIAYQVVPLASNLNAIKVKGKYPDAVSATAAGVILTLIFNFIWFITSSLGDDSTVAPAK